MSKNKPIEITSNHDRHALKALTQRILDLAKQYGAEQAEVSVGASHGFSVAARHGEVETVEYHQDQGFGVTVYLKQCLGSVSLSDTQEEAIQAAVQRACHIARYTASDPFSGLADKEELGFNYPFLQLAYPWSITVEDAIKLACLCEQKALSVDQRIIDAESVTVSTSLAYHVYANSHGFIGDFETTAHEISCVLIAKQAKEMQRDYSYSVHPDPSQLASIDFIANDAAQRTVNRLGAQPLRTMRVPVIFAAQEARGFIGHFVSAISGSALYKKASFLFNRLNTRVFPDFMCIQEAPHLQGALGSAPFDNDGVATRANQFVQEGILSQYILSAYSAKKLGMRTTGNAGGVHNLIVQPGDKNLQQLLQSMDKGILITELIGDGVNILTGDYSRGVVGFWIEQGKIQYPVHEITIASTLQAMYQQIVAVGNDVDLRGNIRTGSILIEDMMIAGK